MQYKRILLKLSGESLMGNQQYGIDASQISSYARQIKEIADMGVEVAIVIGGGNIFRGLSGLNKGVDRVKGDQMGMLATVINSLALQSGLQAAGQNTRLYTSIQMAPVGELYSNQKAIEAMKNKEVVIVAGGTGNPFFTTDTASALRGVELQADVFLKGTRVDGIYTADPEKDPTAIKFETLKFSEAYQKNLKIMDLTAFTLCQENNLPVLVFDMNKEGNLKLVLKNPKIGTLLSN